MLDCTYSPHESPQHGITSLQITSNNYNILQREIMDKFQFIGNFPTGCSVILTWSKNLVSDKSFISIKLSN